MPYTRRNNHLNLNNKKSVSSFKFIYSNSEFPYKKEEEILNEEDYHLVGETHDEDYS